MGLTNAERQRRFIAKLKAQATVSNGAAVSNGVPVTNGRTVTNDAELETAHQRIAELEAEIARLQLVAVGSKWQELQHQHKQERADAKRASDATKPPLPPDEVRDRKIKSLETANRNLRAKFKFFEEMAEEQGQMKFVTLSALMKCLHPDQRSNATDADRDEAMRLLTEWKADNARRKRRRQTAHG
jgi:hypothetical protein